MTRGCVRVVLAALAAAGCGESRSELPSIAATVCPLAASPAFEESTAFQGGMFGTCVDGYPVFRIPAVVTTASGVVLAFAEARQSLADPGAGRIDVVMKQSRDCGRTWSRTAVLAENGEGDAHNPTALVVPHGDRASTVWLFFNRRPASPGGELDLPPGFGSEAASIWATTSDDDGTTWSAPRELTRDVKDEGWRVSSLGPGRAIVSAWGTEYAPRGRMIVPGWYTRDEVEGSWAMLSDDGGATWRRGGVPEPGTDESQVVELVDGTVELDARRAGTRRVQSSSDGGETWGEPRDGLAMPPVMASVLRYAARRAGDAHDVLLHSGILSNQPLGLRHGVRVWLSTDEGATWDHETPIEPGFSQYSVLTAFDDGSIGLLYESAGATGGSVGLDIRFARFDLDFLGAGELARGRSRR